MLIASQLATLNACNTHSRIRKDLMQVAQLLCLKLTQKTDSAEQWRKQALESGVLHACLCGLQSEDQTIAESCAGNIFPPADTASQRN